MTFSPHFTSHLCRHLWITTLFHRDYLFPHSFPIFFHSHFSPFFFVSSRFSTLFLPYYEND